MAIVWSAEAVDDFTALRTYIANDNPVAARQMALHILDCVETLLTENLDLGRPGRVPGTRELIIASTPFIVPYRVEGQSIQV